MSIAPSFPSLRRYLRQLIFLGAVRSHRVDPFVRSFVRSFVPPQSPPKKVPLPAVTDAEGGQLEEEEEGAQSAQYYRAIAAIRATS